MHSPKRHDGPGRAAPRPERLDDLVLAVSRRLRRRWAHGLSPWGLSPHQSRALRVATSYGDLRLGDLAEHLRIAPRSATEVVDGLVERGLLERVADPADRRATLVRPTPEGERVGAEVDAARAADAEALFGHLAADERTELARLLRRVVDTPEDEVPSGH